MPLSPLPHPKHTPHRLTPRPPQSNTTKTGTISLGDLEQFCPEIDFKTPCANAPTIEPGACLDGYYLSAAWSTKASLFTVALASALAAAAALLL